MYIINTWYDYTISTIQYIQVVPSDVGFYGYIYPCY